MSHYAKPAELPATIPVFPLTGALLFPRWSLPLNIFEPRYLNMIDDVMSAGRLLGMIQPLPADTDRVRPALSRVGCLGRVTAYAETEDGRYLITLSGVCRFVVVRECAAATPYRQVEADYDPFSGDLRPPETDRLPGRDRLVSALRSYLSRHQMRADWKQLDDTPMEMLVNALCAGCPFGPVEKQALLEAPGLRERAETLIALLELDVAGDEGGWIQ